MNSGNSSLVEESPLARGETRLGSGRGVNRTESIDKVLLLQSWGFLRGKKRLKEGSGQRDGIPWLCPGPGHVQMTVCENEGCLHRTVIFGLYDDEKSGFVVLGPVLLVLDYSVGLCV